MKSPCVNDNGVTGGFCPHSESSLQPRSPGALHLIAPSLRIRTLGLLAFLNALSINYISFYWISSTVVKCLLRSANIMQKGMMKNDL
jgi:hypothetical protein